MTGGGATGGTVLVTGATGTVGGEVLRQLVAESVKVCAAVHAPGKAARPEGAGIDTVAFDWDRPGTWVPRWRGRGRSSSWLRRAAVCRDLRRPGHGGALQAGGW